MNWKHVSRSLALAAACIGGLGFAGWVFDIDALKRIHPAWVTMKANTALCLILAGFAVALLVEEKISGFRRRVMQACAGIIFGVGFFTFGEHLGWWPPVLDQALFAESLGQAGRSFPGRMNPPSTINFMLLGLGILFIDARARKGWWPAQRCAFTVIAVTYAIFLIYFYEVELPERLKIYLSIALHTTLAFLLLATALLLARPDHGNIAVFLAANTGGIIARRMLPAAIFLPALIGWLSTFGRNSGYFERGGGTALLAGSLTLIFASLVWWAAKALESANAGRRNAEAARLQLSAIVDSSADAILSKTLESIVTSWNAGAERLFGYTAAEMIGQPVTRIIPPERQSEEIEILRRLRAGEEIQHFETVRVAKDGSKIEVSLSISPMRDEHGTVIGASKIARDITERRENEAALVQAHAKAEAANRAKDEFLAVLSHELRTPLTPALMAVSDLESAPPADPAVLRASLALIRRNIELEARLVDDLLDLTRISRGKLRIASVPVDLHTTLSDALAIAEPMFREKGIVVASELTALQHFVRGDAARLAQVFSNLLTNAAKFTPEGGSVTIRTMNTADGAVRVEVSDTGIGIATEVLEEVFEAFRQEEPSITQRFGGLGIGLSVAKSLVKAHGGTIEARSKGRDCGTTFAVTLPILVTTVLAVGSTAVAPPPEPRRSLRVLLVEDHEDTRHILERLMKRDGHRVTTAENVAQALQAIVTGEFDFLLSDLGLPDGTGLDVIAALRERSAIPAVVMSGYGMHTDIARTRAAGFTEHIVKPIPVEVLRKMLARWSSGLEN